MSYAIRYVNPYTGKWKHLKTLRRLKDAQQEANTLRALLDTGKLPAQKIRLNPLTISDVAESLNRQFEAQAARGQLSKTTLDGYQVFLRGIVNVLGGALLCKLSRADIIGYRDALAKKTSNVTANRYLTLVKKLSRHAVEISAAKYDAASEVGYLSEKAHERNRFLLPEELDKLVAASKQTRGKFYMPAIIFLGAEHGASRQEVLSLRWQDINFDYEGRGIIRLFRTKNGVERTAFLMPRTREALLSWKRHLLQKRAKSKLIPKTDAVFCRIDGTPLKSFKRSWWSAVRLAGIHNLHFHDLRHTFCSNLIMSGAGLKDAKEMIGHADIAMTDRYAYLTARHQLGIQKKLADHYGSNT